jgi:hypothetical protein
MVDDQETEYSIDKLIELKQEHETWVKDCLTTYDAIRQADEELYASYVDHWVDKLRVYQWGWTSRIFCHGQPSVPRLVLEDLRELQNWLLTRIWPGRYAELEEAFMEFRWIANDFVVIFEKHATHGEDILWTEKFYKRAYDFPEKPFLLDVLEKQFDDHVDLVRDLGAELIRSANRVCDRVRSTLDRTFLIDVGRLTIEEGPDYQLMFHRFVTQFHGEQKYRGLEAFFADRAARDVHYGSGPPTGS